MAADDMFLFFFQAEDGIRDLYVTGVQTCALPISSASSGDGKTKTGRSWTYVRDDRPAGDTAAPAVWFAYSPDRKGEHPARHLREFRGTLQADAFAGFN